MDKRFFAINKLEPDLVAIFDSEEDRDEWVSFRDAVAREFALPEDQLKWPRLAISEEQAVICSAGKINDPLRFLTMTEDKRCGGYMLGIMESRLLKKSCGSIQLSFRYGASDFGGKSTWRNCLHKMGVAGCKACYAQNQRRLLWNSITIRNRTFTNGILKNCGNGR